MCNNQVHHFESLKIAKDHISQSQSTRDSGPQGMEALVESVAMSMYLTLPGPRDSVGGEARA